MKNGEYILIVPPKDYPGKLYRKGYCYEHHYVYWKNTGKIIKSNESIHHKNGNKIDNRFNNLELLDKLDHLKKHPRKKLLKNLRKCIGCGKRYYRAGNLKNKVFFHSRECFIKHHDKSPGGTSKLDIDNLIKTEMKKGMTGGQFSKKYKICKTTVYNHIKDLK